MRKKILIGVGAFMILFFLFLIWYQATYSMDKLESYEVNDSSLPNKVLIVAQGSEYKKDLVKGITKSFKKGSVYFKVEDVEYLPKVKPDDWDAIIVIHVWEKWEPEVNSAQFLNKFYDDSKMYVVTTSGSGEEHMEGIDGITSASNLDDLPKDIRTVADWLKGILSK